jgi:uncharacterized membrane protein YeaQ/YmgE (transglycosylase-associated protein family)
MSNAEPVPAAQAPSISPIGRVIGTFFSPTPTFQSIAARPGFLLPLILWTLLSLTVSMVIAQRLDFDKMTRARVEKSGATLTEDQIQSQIAAAKKIAPAFTYGIGLLSPIFVSIIVTLVFWAAFKAFGWDFTFKQSLGATTHSFLPGVLGALIFIPILLKRETLDPQTMGDMLHSNLGFLVDQHTSPAIHSLLGSLDVFSLWTAILLTIGYAAAARVSRKGAGGLVFGIWALYVLGKAGLAALLPH